MQRLIALLTPILVLAVILIIVIAGIVVFSYILIFGVILSVVFFLFGYIRQRFFAPKQTVEKNKPEKQGRIIDHEK